MSEILDIAVFKRYLPFGALLLFLGVVTERAAQEQEMSRLMDNDDFAKWKKDEPFARKVAFGADWQGGTESRFAPQKNGDVSLSGDVATESWRTRSQTIFVEPGSSLELRLEAR